MSEEGSLPKLITLQTLTTEFISAENFTQLVFRILNRTVSLCSYKRAALFRVSGGRVRFIAVSGKSSVDKYSETVEKWNLLVAAVKQKEQPQLLSASWAEQSSAPVGNAWEYIASRTDGLAVYWLPLSPWGRLRYGIWFERWGRQQWEKDDLNLLNLVGLAAKAAFERLQPDNLLRRLRERLLTRYRLLLFFAVIILSVLCWRIPLRVVAPCEIIARNPFVVTAPLSGVISQVLVKSGEEVELDDLLIKYDDRVVREEVNIARQQVKVLETGIRITRINALSSQDARAELEIMKYKLKQEEIRLRMAEYRNSKLDIKAETAGTVITIGNPDEWRGRPVEMGEKVLVITDPSEISLRLWISEADNVRFDRDAPVKILLNSMPDESFLARLDYVAQSVTVSSDGVPAVMAEGDFRDVAAEKQHLLRIGLKGNAIIYGEKVSLAYWLLRKPWASLRRIIGW